MPSLPPASTTNGTATLIIADLLTTTGVFCFSQLLGSLLTLMWLPVANYSSFHGPGIPLLTAEPLAVLPNLLLSGIAGAVLVRVLRGAHRSYYVALLAAAFAALAALNVAAAIVPGHPDTQSQIRYGRVLITAAYLLIPLAGAALSSRAFKGTATGGV